MRLIQTAVLCATLTVPSIAHAQSKKIDGPSLAGLCAAAVEFVAGARSSAGVAQPRELQILQRTRDLYLGIPKFPAGEVEGYANAWSQRMAENVAGAADAPARGLIARQIGTIAQDCQKQMVQQLQAAQQQGGTIQPVPQPLPAQPLPVQPPNPQQFTLEPLDSQQFTPQPLTTQPYVIQ